MWGSGNAQELHYIASGNRKLHTTKYVRTQEQLANGNVLFDQLTDEKRRGNCIDSYSLFKSWHRVWESQRRILKY